MFWIFPNISWLGPLCCVKGPSACVHWGDLGPPLRFNLNISIPPPYNTRRQVVPHVSHDGRPFSSVEHQSPTTDVDRRFLLSVFEWLRRSGCGFQVVQQTLTLGQSRLGLSCDSCVIPTVRPRTSGVPTPPLGKGFDDVNSETGLYYFHDLRFTALLLRFGWHEVELGYHPGESMSVAPSSPCIALQTLVAPLFGPPLPWESLVSPPKKPTLHATGAGAPPRVPRCDRRPYGAVRPSLPGVDVARLVGQCLRGDRAPELHRRPGRTATIQRSRLLRRTLNHRRLHLLISPAQFQAVGRSAHHLQTATDPLEKWKLASVAPCLQPPNVFMPCSPKRFLNQSCQATVP